MSPETSGTGVLSVLATPIGNLGDLSPRAAATLSSADVVLCEDTRRTRNLLSHLGIGVGPAGAQLLSSHAHNERDRVAQVIEMVRSGQRVALVSDAGTPGVSDPGQPIVAAVLDAGLQVEVIPGPSAVLAALAVTGLEAERFCFEGFLPRKGPERRARLREIARERRTSVLFEAPARVAATLRDLADVCGSQRRAAVARELTKVHEEADRGPLGELAERWSEARRGEHVIVVSGLSEPIEEPDDDAVAAAVRRHREAGASRRDSAAAAADELGVSRRRAYELGEG